ncbi:MAG: hypothetical protein WC699_18340 [Bacteroidales bacterium]|jgi:hypothetical protein
MKISRLILSAAILWGFTISCSNEIDLYPDDAPQMLFVLGCLDGNGTFQQVKIRKLIAGNEDATQMINDPAHYLPDTSIRVYLEESNGQQHPFSRVMRPPQTGGKFSQDSNLIYELDGYWPFPSRTFTLRIEDPANGKVLSSKIKTMNLPSFIYPEQFWVDRGKYNLTDPLRPFQVNYSIAPASILTVSLKYVDVMFDGEVICRKANHSMTPVYMPHVELARTLGIQLGVQVFTLSDWWLLFDRSIPDDPNVDFRQFYRFDFTVCTGDSAIAQYFYVADRFTDNRRQSFSNIDGGMGLFFATSAARLVNVRPYEKFNTFLASNDTTAHLRFLSYPYTGVYIDPDSTLVNPFLSLLR